MILMIDNYDSFTYNLVQYLMKLKAEIVVFRNDAITLDEIETMNPDMIVISPGPCTPNEAGVSLAVVERFKAVIPILGICLGHQTIGQAFGARVVPAKEPVHGKVHPIRHTGKGVFAGLSNPLQVTRYHSLVLDRDTLPADLEITAETMKGEIMGIRHIKYPVEGVQFHPEAILTEGGMDLLRNFLALAQEFKGKRHAK
ncbi:MAG: aminodeoxychorismate/anthranilate synthase component [Firmicutes bacterium]|nr:aminodeoxychorismate/anthranilate synthase component [Bacillota bacterium]